MKIGIQGENYTRYYGISNGAKRAHEQGYECYDIGYFVNTDTNFFNLPEEKFKAEILKNREFTVKVHLNQGNGEYWVWTSDVSYEYVKINAEYHT